MAEDMERAVETIRSGYEAFTRGDFDAAAASLHPDVDFRRVAEVETPLQGRGAVRENMEPNVWERQELEVTGIEVIGNRVVVDAVFHAVGRASGIELNQEGFHVWEIRDGLGAGFEFYEDRQAAVAAARAAS
jgi:ketosteroid isomerase-like protein